MKFYPLLTKLWLRIEKSLKFRQSKGNNSFITDGILLKLNVHYSTIVLYIQYKFDEIPSIGNLVMAEDGRMDGQAEGMTDGCKDVCKDRLTDRQRQFICINNGRIHGKISQENVSPKSLPVTLTANCSRMAILLLLFHCLYHPQTLLVWVYCLHVHLSICVSIYELTCLDKQDFWA